MSHIRHGLVGDAEIEPAMTGTGSPVVAGKNQRTERSNRSPLSGLTALEELLSVGLNQLSGPIPDLSALDNLEILYLRNNQLTGPIPDSLGELTTLRQLSLSLNQLSGSIPNGVEQPRQSVPNITDPVSSAEQSV